MRRLPIRRPLGLAILAAGLAVTACLDTTLPSTLNAAFYTYDLDVVPARDTADVEQLDTGALSVQGAMSVPDACYSYRLETARSGSQLYFTMIATAVATTCAPTSHGRGYTINVLDPIQPGAYQTIVHHQTIDSRGDRTFTVYDGVVVMR